jgi:hypothetical protein
MASTASCELETSPRSRCGQAPRQALGRHPLSAAATAYARVAGGAPTKILLVPEHRKD